VKSLLRGAQIFKLCPTHFPGEAIKILLRPLWLRTCVQKCARALVPRDQKRGLRERFFTFYTSRINTGQTAKKLSTVFLLIVYNFAGSKNNIDFAQSGLYF